MRNIHVILKLHVNYKLHVPSQNWKNWYCVKLRITCTFSKLQICMILFENWKFGNCKFGKLCEIENFKIFPDKINGYPDFSFL